MDVLYDNTLCDNALYPNYKVFLNHKDLIVTKAHSSKGIQPKWVQGDLWYKANYMGYEGLSESLVSDFLEYSNVSGYVKYFPVELSYNDTEYLGCMSFNFLEDHEELITLEKLHRCITGSCMSLKLSTLTSAKERIEYVVHFIKRVTMLDHVEEYVTVMFEMDALFLNEDRHTNNIALIRNSKTEEYRFCPYFDNGLSLLSDLKDYNLEGKVENYIGRVMANPMDSFKNQLNAVYELYGHRLKFNVPDHFIERLKKKYRTYYGDVILNRAEEILKYQMKTYSYMFA